MPHTIISERCQGCQTCLTQCPADAIQLIDNACVINPDCCVDCGNCKAVCPSNAILEAGEEQ